MNQIDENLFPFIKTYHRILAWDHPRVISLLVYMLNGYGKTLQEPVNNARGPFRWLYGKSELLLPYPKHDIFEAIEWMLRLLRNEASWDKLRRSDPDLANQVLTDQYYIALRVTYIELAGFIPDEDARIADKMTSGHINLEIVEKAREIGDKILNESGLLLEKLNDRFGREEDLPFRDGTVEILEGGGYRVVQRDGRTDTQTPGKSPLNVDSSYERGRTQPGCLQLLFLILTVAMGFGSALILILYLR